MARVKRDATFLCDEVFVTWMFQVENQHLFYSVQDAYRAWLWDDGFIEVEDDYTLAIQIVLVYLSRCIDRPEYRGILVSRMEDPDRWATVPIKAPREDGDENTYWEFLTEKNFRKMYRQWRRSRSA